MKPCALCLLRMLHPLMYPVNRFYFLVLPINVENLSKVKPPIPFVLWVWRFLYGNLRLHVLERYFRTVLSFLYKVLVDGLNDNLVQSDSTVILAQKLEPSQVTCDPERARL